ncbi:MAG: dTDP-4-dehydrorhamnose reductase [Pyrinomonadaceae bacterium]
MKILITGANGMVARAAIEHCRAIGDEVVALTRQELDISNKEAVFETFGREKFDAVLNCAAYTDVDGAETNIDKCYAANAVGAENLALASKKIDSGFVTISTDYVFDGTNKDFYTQKDTPNPQGVYGKAKLEGEIRARNAYARSIVVRSGWIYGAGGTNFLSVMHKLLSEGKNIKAIRDSYGTPTFAADLARRLRELARLDLPGIFHVTNSGKGGSYLDFAEKVYEIGGFDKNLVEAVSFADLKRPAPRPQSSKLACLFSEKFGLKPLRNWETALAEFMRKGEKEKKGKGEN